MFLKEESNVSRGILSNLNEADEYVDIEEVVSSDEVANVIKSAGCEINEKWYLEDEHGGYGFDVSFNGDSEVVKESVQSFLNELSVPEDYEISCSISGNIIEVVLWEV